MPECVVSEAQSAGAHLKLVETRGIFHKGKETDRTTVVFCKTKLE